jgi:hypothetical protein
MNQQLIIALSAIKPGQNVGIVGSQKYGNLGLVDEFVSQLPKSCIIITGDAAGVDTAAINAAKKYGLKYISVEAEWTKYGNSAGMKRNPDIVKQCDVVVAFHDGTSKGTLNSLGHARRMHIDRYIIDDIKDGLVQMSLF